METAGMEKGERAGWKQAEWKREGGQDGNSWSGKGREGRMKTVRVERGERAGWKQLEWKRERGQNENSESGKGRDSKRTDCW